MPGGAVALGGRIEIDVVPNLDGFDSELRQGLEGTQSAAEGVGTAIGVALAAGTAIAAVGFKDAIALGIEFEANLNQLQAVSGATAQQMSQVSATATRLGSDLSLPATSAADAATAMLELAKGGLTVDQAMQAAKGTLQLAAAAQISGAEAAQIQSAALNSYGLAADQAGRVSDVLANSANAASGEITEFADAMQQVGAVANQFGVSLEDTSTALSLFANAGIRGSDAGTLLKTALLALANPSKPAQRAMEELSLTAFDAAGNFVGLESIFGQLREASGRLTPEMYAQATATVFGSDAARLAGVAAGTTAESWDQMAAAVGKAGGAQEVAAAQMKGLGGALQGLNSQLETQQLLVFDAINEPLEAAVRAATELVPKIGAGIVSGLNIVVGIGRTVGPQFASGIAAGAGEVVAAGQALIGPFGEAIVDGLGIALSTGAALVEDYISVLRSVVTFLTPIASGFGEVATAATESDGALSAVGATFTVVGDAVSGLFAFLAPVGALIGGLVSGFASLPGPIQSVVLAMLALRFAAPLLAGIGGAFNAVTQNTGIFGRALSGLTAPIRAFGAGVNQAVQSSRVMTDEQTRAAASANAAVGAYGRLNQGVAGLGRGIAGSVLSVRQFGQEMATQRTLAAASGTSLTALGAAQAAFRTSTLGSVTAARGFGEQVSAIRAGAIGAGTSISGFAASMQALGTRVPVIAQMGAAFATARASVSSFGIAAGTAAAAATGLRAVGTGLIGALGGPFGLAITGTIVALGLFAAANAKSKADVAAHQAQISSLTDALKQSQGAFNQAAIEQLASTDAFKTASEGAKQFGISLAELTNAATSGGAPLEGLRAKLQAIVEANSQFIVEGEFTSTRLNEQGQAAQKALTDLDALVGVVNASKQSYADFAAAVDKADGSMVNGAESGATLKTALDTLGDAASSADEKTRALTDALDALSGGQVSAEKANARLNESMAGIGESFAAAGREARAAGTGILSASGAINTTTEAGRELLTETTDLSRNMSDTAQAAFTAAGGFGNLAPATTAARDAAQRAKDAFIEAATAAGLNAQQAEALAVRYGLVPDSVVTLITANGLTQVEQELLQLKTRMDQVPTAKTITVQTLSSEARQQLEALGIQTRALPDGQIEVILTDDKARARFNDFMTNLTGTVATIQLDGNAEPVNNKITGAVTLAGGKTGTITIDGNQTPVNGKIQATVTLIDGTKGTITIDGNPDPATGQINAVVQLGHNSPTQITINPNDLVSPVIEQLRQPSSSTHTINVVVVGGGLAQQLQSSGNNQYYGGILSPMHDGGVLGFAAGGTARRGRKVTPMKGGIASIVPPNSWRIVGDRLVDDEAYIPINNSRRSHRIFEETARRMGYAVARRFAEGGLARDRSGIAALRATHATAAMTRELSGIVFALRTLQSQLASVAAGRQTGVSQTFNMAPGISVAAFADEVEFAMRKARRGGRHGR